MEGFFSCPPSKKFGKQLLAKGINYDAVGVVGNKIDDFAPYDLVFIDADHYEETVYSDLSLSHNHLACDGIITLHDFSGKWANEVKLGVERFLQDQPSYSLKVWENLGFLTQGDASVIMI